MLVELVSSAGNVVKHFKDNVLPACYTHDGKVYMKHFGTDNVQQYREVVPIKVPTPPTLLLKLRDAAGKIVHTTHSNKTKWTDLPDTFTYREAAHKRAPATDADAIVYYDEVAAKPRISVLLFSAKGTCDRTFVSRHTDRDKLPAAYRMYGVTYIREDASGCAVYDEVVAEGVTRDDIPC